MVRKVCTAVCFISVSAKPCLAAVFNFFTISGMCELGQRIADSVLAILI